MHYEHIKWNSKSKSNVCILYYCYWSKKNQKKKQRLAMDKCREDLSEKRIIQSIPILSLLNIKDIYEDLLMTKSLNR